MYAGMLNGEDILFALEIAVAGFTFSRFLIQPGHIFDWYGNFIRRLQKKYPKFADPLGFCPLCFSGQLAFWLFLYFNFFDYHIIRHILFTSITIFMVATIGKIYGILKKVNGRLRDKEADEERDMA